MTFDDIKDTRLSLYANVLSHAACCVTLSDVLNSFGDERYRVRIEAMRALYDSDKAAFKRLKTLLPAVTFGGMFDGGHRMDNLTDYSSLMIIDIDKLPVEELEGVRTVLLNDRYIFAVWLSPSGRGIKALVHLMNDTKFKYDIPAAHRSAFVQICDYLFFEYGIEVDKSGSDVSRLCYVSYDGELVVKDNFEPFVVNQSVAEIPVRTKDSVKAVARTCKVSVDSRYNNSHGKNARMHRIEIKRILRYLSKHGLSITQSYEDWYRVGFAIADTFTFDIGEKVYHQLCALDGADYDKPACDYMLLYCYSRTRKIITFATILYLAKVQGYGDSSQGG